MSRQRTWPWRMAHGPWPQRHHYRIASRGAPEHHGRRRARPLDLPATRLDCHEPDRPEPRIEWLAMPRSRGVFLRHAITRAVRASEGGPLASWHAAPAPLERRTPRRPPRHGARFREHGRLGRNPHDEEGRRRSYGATTTLAVPEKPATRLSGNTVDKDTVSCPDSGTSIPTGIMLPSL